MKSLVNKIKIVLQWIGVAAIVIGGVLLAVFFRVNIGSLISRLLNGPKQDNPVVTDLKGVKIGERYKIVANNNPLRDKSMVVLETGTQVQLPRGVVDTDVEAVTIVSQEAFNVHKTDNTMLTSVFDVPTSSGG